MSESAVAIAAPQSGHSLLSRMASRFGVEPNKMLATLKATAFKGEVSNEQMMALLIVAEQYRLNPWVKEIYAFPDKNNGIVPVVGVDGWLRILNEHPQYDGVEFTDGPVNKDGLPEWIEARIFRKDRAHPTVAREYLAECKRGTGPWGSHPRRMLRHKALIQGARMAMAFVGIYDQDEAERIVEGTHTLASSEPSTVSEINSTIRKTAPKAQDKVIDAETGEITGDRPPLNLDGDGSASQFTYAEVREAIERAAKAKSADKLAEAEDMVRGAPPQFHDELRTLAKDLRAGWK